jgi:hypothetical protein
MSILTHLSSAIIGLVRGENAKQKFLYVQQSKKAERRLKSFWQKNDLAPLDETGIRSFHSN